MVSHQDLPKLLRGKTILITRAAGQSSHFREQLIEAGAQVIEMPTLVIGAPSSWEALDQAITDLSRFDWLILTSTNGVDYFFARLKLQNKNILDFPSLKIAVVGKKTAESLQDYGGTPTFIPPDFVADSLVANFPESFAGKKILFPRVESGGRDVLVKELSEQEATVIEVAAYESRCPEKITPEVLEALQNHQVDLITFTSSKTVRNFCQLVGNVVDQLPENWLGGIAIASIGPETSKTCRMILGRCTIEAKEYTIDGLVSAILNWSQSLNQ